MRNLIRFPRFLLIPLLLPASSPAALHGADSAAEGNQLALEFTEWQVPWENTRPRDPFRAPDGTIWFVGQTADYIARLDPETGEMSRFDVPGSGPHTVVVDSDGTPWFAANRDGYIGELDPRSGDVTRHTLPDGVGDPHTFAWTSDGKIWFTVQRAGFVGKLDPASGEIEVAEVPGSFMRPYGIVVDSNDRPWFACLGTNAIGTVDPAEMKIELTETPDEGSRIRRIGVDSRDRIWWTDAARGYLGVYDPENDSMDQWQSPGGERSALYAMAVDSDDRIWFAETGLFPNRIVGFDSASSEFVSVNEVPSGGTSVRHMVFDPEANALWFGTDTNTITRAKIPDSAPAGQQEN